MPGQAVGQPAFLPDFLRCGVVPLLVTDRGKKRLPKPFQLCYPHETIAPQTRK